MHARMKAREIFLDKSIERTLHHCCAVLWSTYSWYSWVLCIWFETGPPTPRTLLRKQVEGLAIKPGIFLWFTTVIRVSTRLRHLSEIQFHLTCVEKIQTSVLGSKYKLVQSFCRFLLKLLFFCFSIFS